MKYMEIVMGKIMALLSFHVIFESWQRYHLINES